MHVVARSLVVLLFAGAAACSSGESPTAASGSGGAGASGAGTGGEPDAGAIGGDRPVEVIVPSTVKPGVPAPLVILLHGYSISGLVEELYLQLAPLAEERGFLYAHPDGTLDTGDPPKYFWNATDACCNFFNSDVDDSAYLSSVIDQIKARFDVDPKRVYLVGHSNGGYMSYRMACDHADQIAGIASIAGAMWLDLSKCDPSEAVSVLQVHGTTDDMVDFAGTAEYPSASTSVSDWATFNGCSPDPTTGATLDLDGVIAGQETQVTSYKDGCKAGSSAELWAIEGGSHLPQFTKEAKLQMIDFLLAHPKP